MPWGASPPQPGTGFDLGTTSRRVSVTLDSRNKRSCLRSPDFYGFRFLQPVSGSSLLLSLYSISLFQRFLITRKWSLFLRKLIFFDLRVVFRFRRALGTFDARLVRRVFFGCLLLSTLRISLALFCLLIFLNSLFLNLVFLLFGCCIDHGFEVQVFLLLRHLRPFFCNILLH